MNNIVIEKIAAGLRKANGVKPVCIITTEYNCEDEVLGIPLYYNELEGFSNNGVDCEYIPIYTREQLSKYPMLSHWFRKGFEDYDVDTEDISMNFD